VSDKPIPPAVAQHALQSCLSENGEQIGMAATIAQQAELIRLQAAEIEWLEGVIYRERIDSDEQRITLETAQENMGGLRAEIAALKQAGADDLKMVRVPADWEDRVFSAMTDAFEIHRLKDGGLAIDDTQVGVEFACNQIRALLARGDV
jgi:hypothetical protein